MKTLIENYLKERKDIVKKTYEIEGSEETMQKLEKFLSALQTCNCGMSRSIKFHHDGDGSAYLKVDGWNTKKDNRLTPEESESLSNDKLSL